ARSAAGPVGQSAPRPEHQALPCGRMGRLCPWPGVLDRAAKARAGRNAELADQPCGAAVSGLCRVLLLRSAAHSPPARAARSCKGGPAAAAGRSSPWAGGGRAGPARVRDDGAGAKQRDLRGPA
ncbi:MAG: Cardiolipin synthetase, partial [uncultured Lysobacter sp.]